MTGRARCAAAAVLGLASLAGADEGPLALAEAAYQKGNWAQARDLARQGLSVDARRAWRLAGASSCLLRDRGAALEAMSHLSDKSDVEMLRFACQRAGLEISEEDAAMYASPARELVAGAQAAYDGTRYAEAKKLAAQATVKDAKLAKAWRILGAAACWTKDKYTAQKASEHLQPVDQEFIRATCARTLGARITGRGVR